MPRGTTTDGQQSTAGRAAPQAAGAIVLLHGHEYPQGLEALIATDGHVLRRVPDLGEAASLLAAGCARAVLITAGSLSYNDLTVLRLCRAAAPAAAIVMVTTDPPTAWPDLKRALESGATSFLRWPAVPEVVRQALGTHVRGSVGDGAPDATTHAGGARKRGGVP